MVNFYISFYSTPSSYMNGLYASNHHGKDNRYTKENFPVLFVDAVMQNNFCDCGVFLLKYFEVFFRAVNEKPCHKDVKTSGPMDSTAVSRSEGMGLVNYSSENPRLQSPSELFAYGDINDLRRDLKR